MTGVATAGPGERPDEFAEQHDRLARQRCPAYQSITRGTGRLGVDVKVACGRKIPIGRLACPHHWSQLPIGLRRLITAAWVNREVACSPRVADEQRAEAQAEHDHWKEQAFHYWTTGTWRSVSNWRDA